MQQWRERATESGRKAAEAAGEYMDRNRWPVIAGVAVGALVVGFLLRRWRQRGLLNTVEKTIEVDAPLTQVYNQWTQFEQFPQFMQGVEQVKQTDDKHLHWVANVGGKRKEWDAEITQQIPDRRIAWRSVSGTRTGGIVKFEPKDANHTVVWLKLAYEPEGPAETIGDALGILSRRVEGDLERFRDFIEHRPSASGAWRGEIHGERVQPEQKM